MEPTEKDLPEAQATCSQQCNICTREGTRAPRRKAKETWPTAMVRTTAGRCGGSREKFFKLL